MVIRGKSKTELAYAAGLFDGEGYVSIARTTVSRKDGKKVWHILIVGIGMTDRPTIEWFKSKWNGTALFDGRVIPNRKPVYIWRVSSPMAVAFLKDVYQFLRIKKPQADIAFKFQKLRSRTWGRRGISIENLSQRDDLCEQMRALNASRFPHPQRLSEKAPAKSRMKR